MLFTPPQEYRNRFGAATFLQEILDSNKPRPNLVLTSFWVGSEEKILTILGEKKIPLITINSDISTEQFASLGKPRERFPYWLAQLSPNDMAAGNQLAKALIQASRAKRCPLENCRVNMFAITGMSYSAVNIQRINGLKQTKRRDIRTIFTKSKMVEKAY